MKQILYVLPLQTVSNTEGPLKDWVFKLKLYGLWESVETVFMLNSTCYELKIQSTKISSGPILHKLSNLVGTTIFVWVNMPL